MLMMSRRQYDTHGFDRERYGLPMHSVYMDDYRALPLSLSYADRPQLRSAPIATPVERHQQESDQDSQGSNLQSRRRIAVACARCRKRKIKCSGDPGNGSGCQNCRAAGSEACNFFRVGSFPTQAEQTRGFDGSGMAILANVAAYQQPEYATRTQYPHRLATNLPADYATYLECESPVENYGLEPSNTVPNHEPYGSLYQVHDNNGRPYLTQPYNPSTYSESPVQEGQATAEYSRSQASYVDTISSRQQVMTEGHGVFSVGSLQHSLPTPTIDRKLPIPAQNHRAYYADDMLRPKTSSADTSQHHTMASVGFTRTPPANWSTEHLPHSLSSRSSATATTNELMAPPPSATSASTTSTTSEINSVGYAASAGSLKDSPAEVQSIERNVLVAPGLADTRSSTSTGSSHAMYNISAATSSEIILPHHSAAASLYTYSSDPKRSSIGDLRGSGDHHLVNGDEYEPLKHSDPITLFPIHYAPLQLAPTSATRHILPHSPHPNLEASSDGARAHQLQRRPSISNMGKS